MPGDPRGRSTPFGGPGPAPLPPVPRFPPERFLGAPLPCLLRARAEAEAGGTVGARTGSGGGGAMAGLSVRDPAVDRSLRSVFGEAAGRDRDLQRERGRDGLGGGGRRVSPLAIGAGTRRADRRLRLSPQWGTSHMRPRKNS